LSGTTVPPRLALLHNEFLGRLRLLNPMNQNEASKTSPFLRISLRVLLIAILLIGLIFGFWVLPSLKQKKAAEWVRQNGGNVSYVTEDRAAQHFSKAEYGILGIWPGVDFIDNISGIYFSKSISDLSPLSGVNHIAHLSINEFDGSDLSPIANAKTLESLSILKSKITQLDALKELSNLQYLEISNCDLTNIQGVADCAELRYLKLDNTPIHDIQELRKLTGLETLNLSNTKITDFRPLESLQNLTRLSLGGTDVSPMDLKNLRAALPNCHIESD